MITRTRWAWWGWMLAPAALVVGPMDARAAWLRFRNDLGHAVVIQSSWTANGKHCRGKPHYLNPGETVSEWVADARVRRIALSDARPPRKPLFQLDARAGKKDISYAIRAVAGPTAGERLVQAIPLSDPERAEGREPKANSPAVAGNKEETGDAKPKTGVTAKHIPK